jgi:hypothetical protein
MSNDKTPIPMPEIFDAIVKCRSGDISEQLAETLIAADLLRGVMHIGPAPKMRIVFARARKNKGREAEDHILEKLPPQAALRFTNTFGVDFIVSGQLPDSWADDQIAKTSNLFEDLYEVEVSPIKRYRWGVPSESSSSRNQRKIEPEVEDVVRFLSDRKYETRLVYNSAKLPSLSCLAIITTAERRDLEYVWSRLKDEEKQPVRDLFTNHGDRARLYTAEMDRTSLLGSGYAFCEFDSISRSRNGGFMPALNQAYQWRRKMMEKNFIEQVRMIPCAVMTESIDYYDELDESNDRMGRFKPIVRLPYATRQAGAPEDQISFPIWNLAICGGPGSGKSVFAYVIAAALLKEHKFNVLYVNYKDSDNTENQKPQPRKEALEFAKIINYVARTGIKLVTPETIRETFVAQPDPSALYTECAKNERVELILKQMRSASDKSRSIFVFFDELLNQKKNLREDLSNLLTFVNESRTSNMFVGIIHQDLISFSEDKLAQSLLEKLTLVLGSSLTEPDGDCFNLLSERVKNVPLPVYPVTFDEIRGYQKWDGQFVFLPNQAGNSEHPVRHRLPQYSFLKDSATIPEEWTWGTSPRLP